jgi:peptide/nickel transport system substrate-binding protein
VAADPKYNHYWWGHGNVVALFPNDAVAPFNNPDVRLGLAYSIPYAMVERVQEIPGMTVADPEGLTLPSQRGWMDSALAKTPQRGYNPTVALKYFALAGYHKNSSGELVNQAGKQLSFTISVPSSYTDWISAATVMRAAFETLGMSVNLSTMTPSTNFANLATGHFQVAFDWMGFGPTPYYNYEAALDDKLTAAVGQTAVGDPERWRSVQTERFLEEFAGTSSPKTQLAAIHGLEGIMVKDAPVIPLFYASFWDEYVTKDIVGWPSAADPYAEGGSVSSFNEPVILHIHRRS